MKQESVSYSEQEDLGSVYGPLIRIIEESTLAYRVVFAKVFGSPIVAIVLSQYLYWAKNRSSVERGGWFFKTEEDLYNETGVTAKSQRTARELLKIRGVLAIEKRGVPAKNWYKINYGMLAEVLFNEAKAVPSWGDSVESEQAKEDYKKSPLGTTGSADVALHSITEITTETTTEIAKKIIENKTKKFIEEVKAALQGEVVTEKTAARLKEFVSYWTEPMRSGRKLRHELQPTWDMRRRIATWMRRDFGKDGATNGNGAKYAAKMVQYPSKQN